MTTSSCERSEQPIFNRVYASKFSVTSLNAASVFKTTLLLTEYRSTHRTLVCNARMSKLFSACLRPLSRKMSVRNGLVADKINVDAERCVEE